MLRRPPTTLTVTADDIATYEGRADRRFLEQERIRRAAVAMQLARRQRRGANMDERMADTDSDVEEDDDEEAEEEEEEMGEEGVRETDAEAGELFRPPPPRATEQQWPRQYAAAATPTNAAAQPDQQGAGGGIQRLRQGRAATTASAAAATTPTEGRDGRATRSREERIGLATGRTRR